MFICLAYKWKFSGFFQYLLPLLCAPMFIQVSSNILRSRCLSFRCGVTVERQNEGRGRMYGKWVTRAESSALLLASSCPARALFLSCACLLLAISCPTTALHLTSSHSTAARQRVSSEWPTDSPKLCSPATACYAHADERRRFCFCLFFFFPLLSCHCCYFLLLLAIKSMFGQQLACAIHSL